MSQQWMFNSLSSKTMEEYRDHPFMWGGGASTVKFVGPDAAREEALVRGSTAFADHPWDSADPWSTEAEASYRALLKTYYSLGAVRLQAVANGVDITGVVPGVVGEKNDITDRCVAAKAPLCSPNYLSAFATHVRLVTAGSTPGGLLFVQPVVEGPNLENTPPRGEDEPGGAVQDLHAANLALRQQLAAAAAVQSAPQQPIMAMTPAMLHQIIEGIRGPALEGREFVTPPPKAKTGWPKVLLDVKASLKAKEMPPVLKLSRANHDRLKKETKADTSSRRIFLGTEGASLTLPGVDAEATVLTSSTDSRLWSGMSAFFRLFSIMAALPEDDFSRDSMSELLTVWSEVWDSPMGTRAQKLAAAIAFYDKYADQLGSGVWLSKFDSDSRFLLEHMKGDNPGVCKHCSGSGEASRLGSSTPTPSGGGAGGAKGTTKNGPKQTSKRKLNVGKDFCSTMLIQGSLCTSTSCGRAHSPCASCGGACVSAQACKAWDQTLITAKYGTQIDRITSAKRRLSGH